MLVPLTDAGNPYAAMMLELIRIHRSKATDAPGTSREARQSASASPGRGPRTRLDRAA